MGKPDIDGRTGDQTNMHQTHEADFRREVFGLREIFGTRPSLHLTDEQRAQRFWMGMLYSGMAGYGIVGLIVLGYACATWDHPHRYLIATTAVAAITSVLFCYACATGLWR